MPKIVQKSQNSWNEIQFMGILFLKFFWITFFKISTTVETLVTQRSGSGVNLQTEKDIFFWNKLPISKKIFRLPNQNFIFIQTQRRDARKKKLVKYHQTEKI